MRDNGGVVLDAEFSVQRTTTGFDVVLESRGGVMTASGKRRNTDYALALVLLLTRMAALDLAMQKAAIASATTETLTPDQRRLALRDHPYPIRLADLTDVEPLRLDLGRALAAFKSGPDSKGKGTSAKRVRLSMSGAALTSMSPEDFENLLAGGDVGTFAEAETGRRLKYAPIGDFLRRQSMAEVRLSLNEIAGLVGPLGPSAATPQFWANARNHQLSRRRHWFDAGFEAFYEPANQSVRFVRSPGRRFEHDAPLIWTEPPTTDPDTLAERVRALQEKLKARGGPLPPPAGSTDVQKVMGSTTRYNRDPNVIAWVDVTP